MMVVLFFAILGLLWGLYKTAYACHMARKYNKPVHTIPVIVFNLMHACAGAIVGILLYWIF